VKAWVYCAALSVPAVIALPVQGGVPVAPDQVSRSCSS
jgi:hypothetical protein